MKKQLIDNLKALQTNLKICPYLSMNTNIPGKVILKIGKYIHQEALVDLLEEFGNHAGVSYIISIDTDNIIIIEICIKNSTVVLS